MQSLPAIAVLETMRIQADPTSQYIFPGKVPGKPIIDIKRFWEDVCKAADLKDVSIHDLRHTFASHLVSSGVSLPIVGRLLGHTQPQTTQRYAHLADDPLREAVDRYGSRLEFSKLRIRNYYFGTNGLFA